ncbi:vWA domain-containing protein [Catenulispora rubra]|uniref:vWA domain-containing protein n=1 Tax=Catenulispora rubra TaxID=280293 RepID=UPI001892306E|nr:tellurium resistance protein [Catenulispora rubra]
MTIIDDDDSGIMGGPMESREVHFIWILDCSSSMTMNGKISALNFAIREALPAMQSVAEAHPVTRLMVRTATFSDGARWLGTTPAPIDTFTWKDLSADGGTDMGHAFKLVADFFRSGMPRRAMPPVLALISDGQPTDDWRSGLRAIDGTDWGRKAVRIAVAIGDDADKAMMQVFLGNDERRVLTSHNAHELAAQIRWASTEAFGSASRGNQTNGRQTSIPPATGRSVPSDSEFLDGDVF